MRYCYIIIAQILLLLSACDDGDINEEKADYVTDGYTVKLTGNIVGLDSWSAGYKLSLAAFTNKSDYTAISKTVRPDTTQNGKVEVVLNNVGTSYSTVELCFTNRINLRLVSLKTVDLTATATQDDTIRIDVGTLDVGMFPVLETYVFNNECARCHGGNGNAAGNLFLVKGKAYANLVGASHEGIASTILPDNKRVVPGDAAHSVLHNALAGDNPNLVLPLNHETMLSSNVVTMIDSWINNGAKE